MTSPQPTRIGNARPSQLMTTAGVGAVVDLPGMSVVVRGLDAWGAGGLPISEPRLLAQVQLALPGTHVDDLRSAPSDPRENDNANTRLGVPVTTFPRWLRCPACHRLLAIDGTDELELVHRYGRRPDLAKWVHRHCPRQGSKATSRRRPCLPARFVVACSVGHLDEFPYDAFVHQNAASPCPGSQLELRDSGSVLGPRVTITCKAGCKASRNISTAAGIKGAENLPACRGRHPHLQTFTPCNAALKLMVLGASNLWFGVSLSALHLPEDDPAAAVVREHYDFLSTQPTGEQMLKLVGRMSTAHGLAHLTADELTAAVAAETQLRADTGDEGGDPGDLLDQEWQLLCHPTTTREDPDFRAQSTPQPDGYDNLLRQVVEVERLREVQAMIGFTRIDAPSRGETTPTHRVPLSAGRVGWVPAVERRGEGIFVELREDRVAAWANSVADHEHVVALRSAYSRWRTSRDLVPDPGFPVARYLLVHTLSHLLLRQVALECGYGSASIRERLYVGSRDKPTAGLLLSTAASDSEGTLGGLVALANKKFLGRLLDDALRDAESCFSDPLCSERVPHQPSEQLHVAACHACLFASETSCESGNRWLHRGVLVDVADGLAFSL